MRYQKRKTLKKMKTIKKRKSLKKRKCSKKTRKVNVVKVNHFVKNGKFHIGGNTIPIDESHKVGKFATPIDESHKVGKFATPIDESHKVGKFATITVVPSKLYKSKYISNISVSDNNNDIDEKLASMVKSVSNQDLFERPIYSKKISINLPFIQ